MRRIFLASLLLVLMVVAGTPGTGAQESCYADCSDGLTPTTNSGPAAGDAAPGFTALALDPSTGRSEERTLAGLLRGRPLILAFGSYT